MTDILQPYGKFLDTIKIPLRLSCQTESGWPMILSLRVPLSGWLLDVRNPRGGKSRLLPAG